MFQLCIRPQRHPNGYCPHIHHSLCKNPWPSMWRGWVADRALLARDWPFRVHRPKRLRSLELLNHTSIHTISLSHSYQLLSQTSKSPLLLSSHLHLFIIHKKLAIPFSLDGTLDELHSGHVVAHLVLLAIQGGSEVCSDGSEHGPHSL